MNGPADTLLTLGLAVGLASACGLRVFLPVLALGLAARLGGLPLTAGFAWVATTPALLALAAATILEIAAYYIPWLDNVLDAIATPTAVLAGILVSASVLVDVPPFLRWSFAIIAGGGAAAAVQASSVLLRLKSTALTGGIGNPVLATFEWIGAVVFALLSLLLPVMGFAVLLAALLILLNRRPRPHHP